MCDRGDRANSAETVKGCVKAWKGCDKDVCGV